MTNFELITGAAIANKLYTEDEIVAMIESGKDIPLHTYQEWKERGYQVKRGEHAKLKTKIWIFVRKLEKLPMKNEDGEHPEEMTNNYYMKMAHFFTDEQVEAIKA